MPGFSNDTLSAVNYDFRNVQPVVGQVTADGQLPIGSSIAPFVGAATLTAGSNIAVTNGHNSITLATSLTPSFTEVTITTLPTASTDATCKSYVDTLSSGFEFKNTVSAASTATLTAAYNNGTLGVGATLTNSGTKAAFSLDGVSGVSTMRVLIKNQTTSFQNGVYTVTTVGDGSTNWVLTRATDYNTFALAIEGSLVPVSGGTVNANSMWLQNSVVATMGSDAITYQQFSSQPISTTQYAVQVGGIYNSLSSISIGTAGQLFQSGGAGANPAWSTLTHPSTCAQGDLLYGSATNVISSLTKNATASRYLSNSGSSNSPAWAQVDLTTGVTGILPIANGGSDASSMTVTDGTIYFDGTRLVTSTIGSAGQVWQSSGAGVAPAYSTATYPLTTAQGDLLLSASANTITSLAKNATATRYLANTGTNNNAAWDQIALGTGVSGTLAIGNGGAGNTSYTSDGVIYYDGSKFASTSVGSSGQVMTSNGIGFAPTWQAAPVSATVWSVITASQSAVKSQGYFCNGGTAVTVTLPATSAVGDFFEVANTNIAIGTVIAQLTSQYIQLGNRTTTVGTGGSLTSQNVGDSLKLVCMIANTKWIAFGGGSQWTMV